jgi:hypothetical protein
VPTAVFEQRNEDQRRQAEGSVIQEQGDYWPVLDESVAASADCDGTGNDGESVTIAFEDISLKDKFIGQSHWKNGFLDLVSQTNGCAPSNISNKCTSSQRIFIAS